LLLGLAFLGFVGGEVCRGTILLGGRGGGDVGAVGGGGGVMGVWDDIVRMGRVARGDGVADGGLEVYGPSGNVVAEFVVEFVVVIAAAVADVAVAAAAAVVVVGFVVECVPF
jgi:hypothetical protein